MLCLTFRDQFITYHFSQKRKPMRPIDKLHKIAKIIPAHELERHIPPHLLQRPGRYLPARLLWWGVGAGIARTGGADRLKLCCPSNCSRMPASTAPGTLSRHSSKRRKSLEP